MFSHLIAFILGIVIATIGFSGMANIADKGIQKLQQVSKDISK
jgi:hypothetical protein